VSGVNVLSLGGGPFHAVTVCYGGDRKGFKKVTHVGAVVPFAFAQGHGKVPFLAALTGGVTKCWGTFGVAPGHAVVFRPVARFPVGAKGREKGRDPLRL